MNVALNGIILEPSILFTLRSSELQDNLNEGYSMNAEAFRLLGQEEQPSEIIVCVEIHHVCTYFEVGRVFNKEERERALSLARSLVKSLTQTE